MKTAPVAVAEELMAMKIVPELGSLSDLVSLTEVIAQALVVVVGSLSGKRAAGVIRRRISLSRPLHPLTRLAPHQRSGDFCFECAIVVCLWGCFCCCFFEKVVEMMV